MYVYFIYELYWCIEFSSEKKFYVPYMYVLYTLYWVLKKIKNTCLTQSGVKKKTMFEEMRSLPCAPLDYWSIKCLRKDQYSTHTSISIPKPVKGGPGEKYLLCIYFTNT